MYPVSMAGVHLASMRTLRRDIIWDTPGDADRLPTRCLSIVRDILMDCIGFSVCARGVLSCNVCRMMERFQKLIVRSRRNSEGVPGGVSEASCRRDLTGGRGNGSVGGDRGGGGGFGSDGAGANYDCEYYYHCCHYRRHCRCSDNRDGDTTAQARAGSTMAVFGGIVSQ